MRKQLELINHSVSDVDKKLLACISQLLSHIKKREFNNARGFTTRIDDIISLNRKGIESYMTLRVKPLFEKTSVTFSVSFEDIQKQETTIFKWFDEISELVKDLRKKLEIKEPKLFQIVSPI